VVFDLYVAASEGSHLDAVYISAVQMGNQARRQDLAAGGPETRRGGTIFKYSIGWMQQPVGQT